MLEDCSAALVDGSGVDGSAVGDKFGHCSWGHTGAVSGLLNVTYDGLLVVGDPFPQ